MPKRKSSSEKKRKHATSEKAAAGRVVKTPTRTKTATPIEEIAFDKWVQTVRSLHNGGTGFDTGNLAMLGDDEPSVGACLVKSPDGGGLYCVQTTAAACKAMGGTYRGGACGG